MRQAIIDVERKVSYVAQNFATGLTDVTLTVRTPSGDLFEFAPGVTSLVLTETADGEYQGVYTPDVVGLWTEKVVSVVNGDKAIGAFNAVVDAVGAVSAKVDGVETKIDTVDGKVDAIDTAVGAVQTDVTAIDGKVNTIDTEVGAIQTDVTAIDGKVTTIDGKADTISGKVDDVQAAIDALPMAKPGGYFAN